MNSRGQSLHFQRGHSWLAPIGIQIGNSPGETGQLRGDGWGGDASPGRSGASPPTEQAQRRAVGVPREASESCTAGPASPSPGEVPPAHGAQSEPPSPRHHMLHWFPLSPEHLWALPKFPQLWGALRLNSWASLLYLHSLLGGSNLVVFNTVCPVRHPNLHFWLCPSL